MVGGPCFCFEKTRNRINNPAGFKLCIGKHVEFMSICKAVVETNIYPDFIVIDGGEGGTIAGPI